MPDAQMRPLKFAVALKAIALLAFPVAVIAAALLQRSVVLLAGFALMMVIISVIQKQTAAAQLGQPAVISIAGIMTGFAARFGVMVGFFVVLIGIMAMFRETALARSFGQTDALLLLIPAAISMGASAISRRIFGVQMHDTLAGLQAAFNTSQGRPADADGDIIEGEIIDRDS